MRDLARIAKETGAAATRWSVLGFGRASAGKGQSTPRNLLGFKDGTRNIRDAADFDQFVWIKDGPAWQRHGTYQVVRKIQMHIENWDTDRVSDQNEVFGRHKVSGAPLTGIHEFDTPDFDKKDKRRKSRYPRQRAYPAGGCREQRRNQDPAPLLQLHRRHQPYGLLDAGLLFISYQNDPAHFETLQAKLGAADALNEYIAHIGSAIFFVPPAAQEGSYIAADLFA